MQSNPLSVFVFLCGALLVAMAVYAWRHRSIAAARTFSVLLFSMAVYILGYSFELASLSLPAMLTWGKIDANPAAQAIFGWVESPIGRPARQVLETWDGLVPAYARAATPSPREPITVEIRRVVAGRSLYYDVNLTFLTDQLGQNMGRLIIVHDVTERKATEEKLRELSLVDELTGLNNRRGFYLLATQLIQAASRAQLSAALIYADLDGLKAINDRLGHPSGDQALTDTARLLKGACRVSDIVARLGGDEFVILALESRENSSVLILARLEAQLDALNQQAHRPFPLAISFGLARNDPDQPRPLEALLAEADRLMYVQKQARQLAQPRLA